MILDKQTVFEKRELVIVCLSLHSLVPDAV